jgi:hypothetical protein
VSIFADEAKKVHCFPGISLLQAIFSKKLDEANSVY